MDFPRHYQPYSADILQNTLNLIITDKVNHVEDISFFKLRYDIIYLISSGMTRKTIELGGMEIGDISFKVTMM